MAEFIQLDELRAWNADQSWNARQHLEVGGRKFRFNLRRNAYDFQSWARLEVLDPVALTWSVLCSRTIEETPAACLSYVVKPLRGSDNVALEDTRDLLLAEAAQLIN